MDSNIVEMASYEVVLDTGCEINRIQPAVPLKPISDSMFTSFEAISSMTDYSIVNLRGKLSFVGREFFGTSCTGNTYPKRMIQIKDGSGRTVSKGYNSICLLSDDSLITG